MAGTRKRAQATTRLSKNLISRGSVIREGIEMNIILLNNPATTTQKPNVDFVLGDRGSAFVSLTLIISDNTGIKYKLVHDEQYTGFLTKSPPLEKGSYSCTFVIHAFRQGALGPVYDSFLTISDNKVAAAQGSIPTGADDDLGYAKFTLNVS